MADGGSLSVYREDQVDAYSYRDHIPAPRPQSPFTPVAHITLHIDAMPLPTWRRCSTILLCGLVLLELVIIHRAFNAEPASGGDGALGSGQVRYVALQTFIASPQSVLSSTAGPGGECAEGDE